VDAEPFRQGAPALLGERHAGPVAVLEHALVQVGGM